MSQKRRRALSPHRAASAAAVLLMVFDPMPPDPVKNIIIVHGAFAEGRDGGSSPTF